jgi:hypothetical protein
LIAAATVFRCNYIYPTKGKNMGVYKVVGINGEVVETDVTLHPGELLADELQAREILKKRLCCCDWNAAFTFERFT